MQVHSRQPAVIDTQGIQGTIATTTTRVAKHHICTITPIGLLLYLIGLLPLVPILIYRRQSTLLKSGAQQRDNSLQNQLYIKATHTICGKLSHITLTPRRGGVLLSQYTTRARQPSTTSMQGTILYYIILQLRSLIQITM